MSRRPISRSKRIARQCEIAALAEVRSQFGRSYPLVIDGEDVETRAEIIRAIRRISRRSSARWRRRKRSMRMTAVAAAKAHCRNGLHLGAAGGRIICWQAAAVMRRRRFELAAWEVFECGKGWREADGDVCEAIDFCEYYARGGDGAGQPRRSRRARRGEPA